MLASAGSVSGVFCRLINSRVEVFCLLASLAGLQTLLVRFLLLLLCFFAA